MPPFKDNNQPKAKDILYQDSIKEKQKEQERLQLLDDLKDNLTPAKILYSKDREKTETKQTKGIATGGALGVKELNNNQQNRQVLLKGHVSEERIIDKKK